MKTFMIIMYDLKLIIPLMMLITNNDDKVDYDKNPDDVDQSQNDHFKMISNKDEYNLDRDDHSHDDEHPDEDKHSNDRDDSDDEGQYDNNDHSDYAQYLFYCFVEFNCK